MKVPKGFDANLRWRQATMDAAAADESVQAQLRQVCSVSPLFWINAFVWTYRQKMTLPDGSERPVQGAAAVYPMITWLVQDEAIAELIDAIENGHDIDIEKSRDMGASWVILLVFHWYWQFRSNVTFLEASRKEELVYDKNNMDALMQKHLFVLDYQPGWLRPKYRDTFLHLENLENGSAILGESTNGDVGRGGRKTAIMVDEAAAIRNLAEIDASTSQTTACRIFNSTPKGPGTHFHKRIMEQRGRIIRLPWWRHPEKCVGALQYVAEDGRVRWTGPWHRKLHDKLSPKMIAQEIDMDHGQAGEMFFDHEELAKHRKAHVKPPLFTATLTVLGDPGDERKREIIRKRDHEAMALVRGGGADFADNSPWRVWIPLIDGRLPQNLTYVLGIDISNGSGGSNSVITVVADEIGQVVAKFWSAFCSPEELAEQAVYFCVWAGGKTPAFMEWENNGPGGIFGRKVIKLGYKHVYFQRAEGIRGEGKTERWGWHSNQQRKEQLLGEYREALDTGRLVNPCDQSITEAGDYVYDENGLLIPGRLKEESNGGRALHGDHVIADALAQRARVELPKFRERPSKPPVGSFAHRRDAAKRRKDRDAEGSWRE